MYKQCPKCKHNWTLIYDYNDSIVNLHKCPDNKFRKELDQDIDKKVESLGRSALTDIGASAVELLIWTTVIRALAIVIITTITALPILVLD